MVSTRNHPTELPEPAISTPSSRSTRANGTPSTKSLSRRAKSPLAKSPTTKSPSSSSSSARATSPTSPRASTTTSSSSSSASAGKWSHTPSNLTLIWLAISLPLVAWDTGYVLLRPYTMPGGFLHAPIWAPYKLYGEVDYTYGFPAWNAHSGFTGAQASLNVVESVMYLVYLYCVWKHGVSEERKGRGAPKRASAGWLAESRTLKGRLAGVAVLLMFAASVMTVSKTVLYGAHEYFSGFANIGHNDFAALLFLWIIPNGAWIVVPSYMAYVSAAEILQGLDIASSSSTSAGEGTARKRH